MELLFSAVLMLVDLVSWFCEPQQRGESLGAAGAFRRSVSVEKYAGHIFRAESEALAERPAEEGLKGQEPQGTRRG